MAEKIEVPAFYGVKAGMTRIFDENGNHVPVTVIKLIANVVSQVKTKEKDGYEAYQVAFNEKRESLISKPAKGQLKKAGIEQNLSEFAEILATGVNAENIGKEISIDAFKPATYIDVTGISKGRGFAGVMKRHGMAGGPMSHGSGTHRRGGSFGNRASPGRIMAGKRMPGHYGCEKTTVQNILIQEVNLEKGYMLLKGSVPGAKNSFVKISKAIKK